MTFIKIKHLSSYSINFDNIDNQFNEELDIVNKHNVVIQEFKRRDYKPKYIIKPFSNGYNNFTEINKMINKPLRNILTIFPPQKKVKYNTPGILRNKKILRRRRTIKPIEDIYNEMVLSDKDDSYDDIYDLIDAYYNEN